MIKGCERNIPGRHPATVPAVCNCNLSEKPQEILLFSVQKSFALQSPFLNPADLFHIIHAHWLHPCDNANRAGGTRAAGRGGGVCVFCIFPAVGPESFNWIPCCDLGKRAGLFNDYLRLICFLFASRPWCSDCLKESLNMWRTEGNTCPTASSHVFPKTPSLNLLTSLHLLFPFIKDRHVDNYQFCSAAPWLLCSIHPEPSIMPIHGGDNETCVSSLTFIIVVVWWLDLELCRVVSRDLPGH